ncbi:MAG: hypothetical protein ACREFE_14340, partial [Limisphaerales bacterium]
RILSFLKHALPLPRGRILRCANVATNVAGSEHFRIERNVARRVDNVIASNVEHEKRQRVAFEIAIRVANAMRGCALNVASAVASPLRLTFTKLLPQLLTAL